MPRDIDHTARLEWDYLGRCKYRVRKTKKCDGTPGYSGGCQGRYRDDYGSQESCRECGGSGKVTYYVYVRVAQFDAPKPPKGWQPDWVET